MDSFIKNIRFKGEPCIKMSAGGYEAIVAPGIGCNMIRLHNIAAKTELLHYSWRTPIRFLRWPSLVHGIPTMLYPNRLEHGILRSSAKEYHFPSNEKGRDNYIHGFLHSRKYNVDFMNYDSETDTAVLTCSYDYNDNDESYQYMPIDFKAVITYTLSKEGMKQELSITNLSEDPLPVGLGHHTAFMAPFSKDLKPSELRISFPAKKRIELIDDLSTGNMTKLSAHDLKYVNGQACPVLSDINNEMYLLDTDEEIFGVTISNTKDLRKIIYEFSKEFKFLNQWNCGGNNSFYCVEPMTWMINAPNINMESSTTGYREIMKNETYSVWQKLYMESDRR